LDRIRETRDAVGTDSVGFLPCERYNSDQNQIENGIIRTKTAESGRFLDNIWWLSLLYKYVFWHNLFGNGSRTEVNILNVWVRL